MWNKLKKFLFRRKKGKIVCFQIKNYPRPKYGTNYEPKIYFRKPEEYFPQGMNSEIIAYWRVKEFKK